ncbi:hypothetical protein C900_02730 [Fulvivirga imtechensis AK7]|uniref:Colicin V production protein n=1 Tax=Fulvivirga imtechensis AK7 TaxID=1237149 RepID=L8JUY6_9BACT|nr:CvpA family protein [Fulvivirga imtechensis]ELR71389.1 hypothetical protein C900_02730 [Fulvivirga imtechensis AK7]
MSTIDIILIIPIIYGAYRGFKKGFLLEIIAIVAFILAVIGGFKLLHWGMDLLDQYFDISGQVLPYIAFVLIFIGIILLINLLGKGLKKIIDLTILGAADNIAGAVLSATKWAFGLSVILWLSATFDIGIPEEWKEGSILYPYLMPFAPAVVDFFSAIIPFAHDLFDTLKEMLQDDPSS